MKYDKILLRFIYFLYTSFVLLHIWYQGCHKLGNPVWGRNDHIDDDPIYYRYDSAPFSFTNINLDEIIFPIIAFAIYLVPWYWRISTNDNTSLNYTCFPTQSSKSGKIISTFLTLGNIATIWVSYVLSFLFSTTGTNTSTDSQINALMSIAFFITGIFGIIIILYFGLFTPKNYHKRKETPKPTQIHFNKTIQSLHNNKTKHSL